MEDMMDEYAPGIFRWEDYGGVDASCWVFTDSKGVTRHLIALHSDNLDSMESNLVHELSHLVDDSLEAVGIKSIDTEVRAYFYGMMWEKMIKDVRAFISKEANKRKRIKKAKK
jgi:hypothetical protein